MDKHRQYNGVYLRFLSCSLALQARSPVCHYSKQISHINDIVCIEIFWTSNKYPKQISHINDIVCIEIFWTSPQMDPTRRSASVSCDRDGLITVEVAWARIFTWHFCLRMRTRRRNGSNERLPPDDTELV